MAKTWHLVAYDIRDPARLRQAAKKLLGCGSRVQYSVFRCRLSSRERERLRWELSRILDEEDDVLIVNLCDSCAQRLRATTGDDAWDPAPQRFRIL